MAPETAAVLANAPALAFELAFADRRLERPLRHPGLAILLAVEAREMAAEDFRLDIALEALGAGIPARHPSLGVEHVDGIVRDRVDEEPIPTIVGQRRH